MTMPYCILHTEADSDLVLNELGFSENEIVEDSVNLDVASIVIHPDLSGRMNSLKNFI